MRIRSLVIVVIPIALSACGETQDRAGPDAEPNPSDSGVVAVSAPAVGERPKSFAQCSACHSVEPGKSGIGPSLAGVFEADAAHVGDYAYSTAMRESGLVWDVATLDRYLENPRSVVPGTKMSYGGLRDAEQRAELIAYLKTL